MLCYLNVRISDVTNVLCFPNEGGVDDAPSFSIMHFPFLFYFFLFGRLTCECVLALQDIHFQGKKLNEAPAPIGYH